MAEITRILSANPGDTLKIFEGGVPFFGFQWRPALENLAEKDTRL